MLSIFIKPFSTRSQAHSTQTICSRRVDRPFNGTQRFSRAVPTGHCTCDTWPEPIADVMTSAVGPGSIFSYRRSVYTALTYLCVQSAVAKSRVPVTLKACGIRCTAVTEAGPAASTLQLPPGDQSIRDVQDMPSTSCAICMAEHLQNPARIQVCGHCFCLGCIRQWSKSSPEPRCPLCNARFSVLVHDGTEEELPMSAGKRAAVEADLGCLDHAYFRTETRRLLGRAKAAQQAVYRNAQNCGRSGSAESAQAFGTLDDVIVSLNSYRQWNLRYRQWSSMEEEVPFEAQQVLRELYSLDAVVGGIQAGNWERNAVQSAPRRYTADDAEDMSDDDDIYDEYTFDHVGSSNNSSASNHSKNTTKTVARTPGRVPPHRNQRRSSYGHRKR